MKKDSNNIFLAFSCIILLVLWSAMIFVACGNDNKSTCNGREITKLYTVEKYKIHETGVEILATSESGEEKGFFVEHDKVYAYEEDIDEGISRVIILGCSECDSISDGYLYFSREEFKEYIKEKYDIE